MRTPMAQLLGAAASCRLGLLFVLLTLSLLACRQERGLPHANGAGAEVSAAAAPNRNTVSQKTYSKPSDAQIKQSLSPLAFEVTQNGGTEPPFRNSYWDNHEAGLYVDVVTGEPLFSSRDKFDSGTGWPSFTRPVEQGRVVTESDRSHGMLRTEVLSQVGRSHLGHVFDDGPQPTGLRYCMNSASMRFIPLAELEAQGYGAYRGVVDGSSSVVANDPAAQANACVAPQDGASAGCSATIEEAVLAGGCFWGMEELLRGIPGVIDTEVGYAGGTTAKPTYNDVKTGSTGHAESVKILFDPSRISYAELLERWFFKMHDPTTVDRQGNDVGTQYRSVIFYTSAEQKRVAEEVIRKVDQSGKWKSPVVTQVVAAGPFTQAEGYHQDYLQKNPGGYTCHFMRD